MRRALSWVVVSVVLIGLLGMGAGGWYYSDELLPAPAPGTPERSVEVLAADREAQTVTLGPGDDDLLELGTVGLISDDGLVVLDGPTDDLGEGAGRTGNLVEGVWPDAGTLVAASVDTYAGDPAETLGLPFEPVDVPSGLGVLPAWRVVPNGAQTDTWVVLIHGRGGALSESNRMLPVLDALDLPSLTISVRNDPNAPADPDGYGYYGDREWEDLQAAVDHLVATEDAERIVLAGYSQGASIALGFLRRSPDAELVEAAVLVSPLVSLNDTLVLQAQLRDIPDPVIPPLLFATRLITNWRAGLDFSQVDHLGRVDELPPDVPILMTHGREDQTVPIEPSREFARARPGQIVYEEYPHAGHVREWNVDRERFEGDLRAFLDTEVITTEQ